nr:MAG TPA: hypothetical protein [Caudoviricetes sp.]
MPRVIDKKSTKKDKQEVRVKSSFFFNIKKKRKV